MSDLIACPSCGASNPADAQWCGQCFTELQSETAPPPEPEAVELATPTRSGWECRTCGHTNAVEASHCELCNTGIYDSYGAAEERRIADPEGALRRAIMFPGFGYSPFGYGAIGVVVGFLAVACALVAIMLLIAGIWLGLFLLLIVIAIWGASILDTAQLARGAREPLLRPRVLSVIGGVVVAVLMITVLLTFQSATN